MLKVVFAIDAFYIKRNIRVVGNPFLPPQKYVGCFSSALTLSPILLSIISSNLVQTPEAATLDVRAPCSTEGTSGLVHRARARPEICSLTGIRAVAATWVVIYHMRRLLQSCYPGAAHLFNPIVTCGYLGVDIFFILSGFIIYYNYGEKLRHLRVHAVRGFLWARLARLWPVHAATLLLFVLLLCAQRANGGAPANPSLYNATDFLRNLLLIHGWGIPLQVSWNVPAWSISCEWLAYLAFPILIAPWLHRFSARASLCFAASALTGTAAVCQVLHDQGSASYGVLRIAGEFSAGCGLCQFFLRADAKALSWQYLGPAAMGASLLVLIFRGNAYAYWCVPFFGAFVLGIAYQRCPISQFCATKFMVFGGCISYSMYMIHELALIVLQRIEGALGRLAPFIYFSVIVMAASVLFYLIEEPCRHWMRSLLQPQK